jgi:hypothetical protein
MATELGVFLRGELVRVRPGKEWTPKDATESVQPGLVVITTNGGETSVKVEYRSMDDASAAVAGVNEGDTVELRVFPRAYGDRVYFGGRNVRNGNGNGHTAA